MSFSPIPKYALPISKGGADEMMKHTYLDNTGLFGSRPKQPEDICTGYRRAVLPAFGIMLDLTR